MNKIIVLLLFFASTILTACGGALFYSTAWSTEGAGARCESSVECGLSLVCEQGKCAVSDSQCNFENTDGFCPKGKLCQAGACVCQDAELCPCPESGCVDFGDRDCKNCSETQACDAGLCLEVTAENACSTERPTGLCAGEEVCVGGFCVPISEDNSCSSERPAGLCPSGLSCRAGFCEPTDENPCDPSIGVGLCPTGQFCNSGGCVLVACDIDHPFGACEEDEVCSDGVCNPLACSPTHLGGFCGLGEFCSAGGACIADDTCLVQNDCPVSSRFCAEDKRCRLYGSCLVDPDCSAQANFAQGYGCSPAQSCVEREDCSEDSDCVPTKFCGSDNKCRQDGDCTETADCGGGEFCSTVGECLNDGECKAGGDCDTGEFCSSTEVCIVDGSCVANADCAPGLSCDAGSCVVTGESCDSNNVLAARECEVGEAGCTTGDLLVGVCAFGENCCPSGKICSNLGSGSGVCVDTGDCQVAPDCPAADFSCVENSCTANEACSSQADCDGGTICTSSGYCISPGTCFADADCASGEQCSASFECIPVPGCGNDRIEGELVPPNIMILLDQSASMNVLAGASCTDSSECASSPADFGCNRRREGANTTSTGDGTTCAFVGPDPDLGDDSIDRDISQHGFRRTRWEDAGKSLHTLVSDNEDRISFGLRLFPQPCNNPPCTDAQQAENSGAGDNNCSDLESGRCLCEGEGHWNDCANSLKGSVESSYQAVTMHSPDMGANPIRGASYFPEDTCPTLEGTAPLPAHSSLPADCQKPNGVTYIQPLGNQTPTGPAIQDIWADLYQLYDGDGGTAPSSGLENTDRPNAVILITDGDPTNHYLGRATDICASVCSDGLMTTGGSESDVDCGGWCDRCADGLRCLADTDCESGLCRDDVCVPQSCDNGAMGGSETDTDCGGACGGCSSGPGCSACVDGSRCGVDGDCLSGLCVAGICADAAHCSDGRVSGDETGIDCGGACSACSNACNNGVKDAGEINIDCGGACDACDGFECSGNGDCASDSCVAESSNEDIYPNFALRRLKVLPQRVRTYVVGFQASGGLVQNLNCYAHHGATRRDNCGGITAATCDDTSYESNQCFYNASNASALSAAFTEIADEVASCDLDLNPPPGHDGNYRVYLQDTDDGSMTRQIESLHWRLELENNQLEILGSACQSVLDPSSTIRPVVIYGGCGGGGGG